MRNSSPVTTGQTIANKYQIERVLGEGGMGVVVSAWHLGLEQRVAIKLLLRERVRHDASAIARFQREARAAARVQSEHVCRVLDTGSLDDNTPFLVMEYLEGRDLAEELLQRGRLPASEAVALVLQACEGLIEAHAAGIVHRDLKPANLFVTDRPDGSRLLKVLDFGVSKSLASSGMANLTLTKSATLVGSPIYMSPEQLRSSKDVDGRTDIWALGAILYELITGRTPFYGETIPQLVHSVLNTLPTSFDDLCVPAAAGLEPVVLRALAKQRDERYASVAQLKEALMPYAPNAKVAASGTVRTSADPPVASEADAALPGPSLSGSGVQQTARPTAATGAAEGPTWSRTRWAGIVLLLIAGSGLLAYLSRRHTAAPKPPIAQAGVHDAGAPHAEPEPAQHTAAEDPPARMGPPPSTPQSPAQDGPDGRQVEARPASLPEAPEPGEPGAEPPRATEEQAVTDGAGNRMETSSVEGGSRPARATSRPIPARPAPGGSRPEGESGSAPAAAGELPDFGGRR